MKKISSLLFFVFILNASYAQMQPQAEEVRFSGIVFDSGTTRPLANVNCRRGGMLTTTDLTGRFAMNTAAGDTIYFTHIGYRPYEVVVPDSLPGDEYILAVFVTSDTVHLPEVVVRRRYGEQTRQYRMNAKNNMAGLERDAFSLQLEWTPEQNQKRVLDDFAASTNKGHVDVKLGVGLESLRVYQQLRRARKFQNEPEPLRQEEVDLLKMIFSVDRKEKSRLEN
ncbi:hypothetical protein [Culturomica sp.]|uniref:hypothetical protein n=1 Tax=Culturomica sp. TaxID=1926652 RepID=UPI000E900B34|nr:hypothetical protein [Culturomica sp.]HBO27490.1 hypothetical protein [Culturomica sp.]